MKNPYEYTKLEKLISKAQNNDIYALNEIIKRQQSEIFKTLKCLEADEKDIYDLTQEILLKIISKIKNLRNPKYFKSWQNQIIIRHFYDYLRKNKKRKINLLSLEEEIENINKCSPNEKYMPLKNILENELNLKLKTSINKLSSKLKKLIIMRDIKGLSYKDISKITGLQEGTVKSRIARAREIIKEEIRPYILE